MQQKKLVECGFFVPIRRDRHLSDGERHSDKAWRWLFNQLHRWFPEGLTEAPGLYRGYWKDPRGNTMANDESRRFVLAIPRRKVTRLRRILREACKVFYQKCVYLSIAGYVEFVEAKANDST